MNLILLIIGLILLIMLLWWLLIASEGVYLGRGVVIWLYDVYARRYDQIKGFEDAVDSAYLGRPLLHSQDIDNPLILDVATGTGRLPKSLFRQPRFQGKVVGIDLSRKMLAIAAKKLEHELHANQLYLMHQPAEELPFPDNTFDAVVMLEALEFMMSPRAVLIELIRVVRPGGTVLLTNRQSKQARWAMPGKFTSHFHFVETLHELGVEVLDLQNWQQEYALIWALKDGDSPPTGARPLGEIWLCPRCQQTQLSPNTSHWHCENCENQLAIAPDGVIETGET